MSKTFYLALVMIIMLTGAAVAADIVTVPTANQLGAGDVDVAYYYLGLDLPTGAPQFAQVQTLYLGLANDLELDVHRYRLDKAGSFIIFNGSLKLLDERKQFVDLVIGGRDVTSEMGSPSTPGPSGFICAAKTLNPPVGGPPKGPVYRLHLSVGTKDETLLGNARHNHIFGGLQMVVKFKPHIGVIALNDARDWITGVTFTPTPKWPTFKGGKFGKHWWVGTSYTFNLK